MAYKSAFEKFYIKEHFLTLFYDFIEELDKIPDQSSKVAHLKVILGRNEGGSAFKIICKYFMDRIVYSDQPEIRILPLSMEEDSNKKTFNKINLPQLDLVLSKGHSVKRLRQEIEDYIYSTKGVVQRFMCDYFNGTNLFKIPKDDLKAISEHARLRLNRGKVDSIEVLSEHFIGYNKEYLKLNKYLPKDWVENNPDKVRTLPTPRLIDFFRRLYWRKYFRKKEPRALAKYKHYIENNAEPIYTFRFPAIVFQREASTNPLVYYIKRNDLVRTNMTGYLSQYVAFLVGRRPDFALVGYYVNDELRLMVCTKDNNVVRNLIEEKSAKYSSNPTTLMRDYTDFRKLAKEKISLYNVTSKFTISRKKGIPLMDLHHLLNHIVLMPERDRSNIVIMLVNGVLISPTIKVIPALLLGWDTKTDKAEIQTLDEEKRIFKINANKISYPRRSLNPFVGKKVYIVDFELGGKFLLVDLLHKFSWTEESYHKSSPNRLSYW